MTPSPLASAAVLTFALAGAVFAAGCVPTMSNPPEYAEKPISAQAGETYFLKTGGGDPYAAGMAYPIFIALMEDFPEELGKDWAEFADKFGMIPDPAAKGDPQAPPIGFYLTTDPNSKVPWLVGNCTMCHTERIRLATGDVIVPGLGNKAVRPHAYVNALMRIGNSPRLKEDRILAIATRRAREWKVPWPEPMRKPIVNVTLSAFKDGAKKRAPSTRRFDGALPGRMATIESFALGLEAYRKQPIRMPEAIGWAKVPDVRSFQFRDTFSYDGSGYGSPQALVLEADFLFGARPEWYLSHPHIATSVFLYLRSFTRKLPYPAPIDAKLALRGKEVFEGTCATCHGYYVDHGDEMRVSYKERVVPIDMVGTDRARLDAVTPSFVTAANEFPPMKGYTAVKNTGGYVPPVLLDVWARGVLGHAGQWPSVEALATPPEERPRKFIVDTKGLYDLERVGVRYEAVAGTPRALRPGEYLYDGDLPGLGTQGHPFLSELDADDRRAAIEYLKTL
ncbi:MAG: hypothetical protein KF782_16580 [Labilithrix sp.]|nr:hypothetical protein [Labilithrix sp.]